MFHRYLFHFNHYLKVCLMKNSDNWWFMGQLCNLSEQKMSIGFCSLCTVRFSMIYFERVLMCWNCWQYKCEIANFGQFLKGSNDAAIYEPWAAIIVDDNSVCWDLFLYTLHMIHQKYKMMKKDLTSRNYNIKLQVN